MIGIGFDYRYERLDVPISMRAKTFNGYLYFSWMTLGPESERRGDHPAVRRELPRAHAAGGRLLGARRPGASRDVRLDRGA